MNFPFRLARILSGALFACLFATQAYADTLSYISEPGDYVGQGQTKSFSGDFQYTSSLDERSLEVYFTDNANSYSLRLAAPLGKRLLPGYYPNAQFLGRDGSTLSFSGEARGCNTQGNFTIHESVFGPFGYIQALHASWEQNCGAGSPSLFGEVYISNPPPPPALTMEVALDTNLRLSPSNGNVIVAGTIKCSQAVTATVFVDMTQNTGSKKLAFAGEGSDVACGPTQSRWSFAVVPVDYGAQYKFAPGAAQLNTTTVAIDPSYDQQTQVESSAVVKLSPANR